MPITAIDKKAALVIIDLQKGIVANATVHPVAGVVANANFLAETFRARALPVVIVHVDGAAPGRTERPRPAEFSADFAELVPEMTPHPVDIVITKKTWGAFTNTGLDEKLKEIGVTQIVLAGISTSAGVESTARFASELGYNVAFATDAMTDMNAESHDNSVMRIFPRIGESGTSEDIVSLLKTG